MQRPRSANRARSASKASKTRTRSYFDSKEGKSEKDDDEEVPAPFFHSNDEIVPPKLQSAGDDEAEPTFILLGDLDDESWKITRTVKPQDTCVDMQMSWGLADVKKFYNLLRGNSAAGGDLATILHRPGKLSGIKTSDGKFMEADPSTKAARSLKSHGPIGFLHIMCKYILAYVISCFGGMKDSQPEEDGLFVSSHPTPKSSNILRMEERILRELSAGTEPSVSPKAPPERISKYGEDSSELESSAEKKPIAAKIDESFWMIPGQQLVGPRKRSGNVQQDVELAIQVQNIQFNEHPEFTIEERALKNVSSMYEQYRKQIDSNSIHCLVTRLTDIFRRIRSTHASIRHEESKESNESSAESMMITLLDDLRSSSSTFLAESDSVRALSSQVKRGWEKLLSAREKTGFTSSDVELETSTSSSSQLRNDVNQLVEEINATKPILGRIIRDETYAFDAVSFEFLDDLISTLSKAPPAIEVLELARQESSQPGWFPKEEKLRRKRINSERYFARLLINGNVVGDTNVGQLNWPSFAVKLGHRFNCKMAQKPEDVCIQLWKSSVGFVPDTCICTCYYSIIEQVPNGPDQSNNESMSSATTQGEKLQFSSKPSNAMRQWKGTLLLASSCSVNTIKRSGPATRMAKMPQREKRLIGNRNRMVVSKSEDRVCPDRQSMMAFKLRGVLFSNASLLEEPLRHILIKKRNADPTSVPSPIPINELLVQNSDVYQDLARTDDSNDHQKFPGHGANALSESNEMCRRKHQYSDVIQDVGLFRFINDQEFGVPLPPRKRVLYPKSVARVPTRNNRCSLLLTIVGGKNVLTKLDPNASVGNAALVDIVDNNLPLCDSAGDDKEEALGVFAKIKVRGGDLFEEATFQTKVVNGSLSPQWKDTICVYGGTLKEGSLPSTMMYRNEFIDILLFDCTKKNLRQMGGYYDDEDTKISDVHYLGCASIPLITVLEVGTISGFVHCQSPDVVVGYVKESSSLSISGGENEESVGHSLSLVEKDPCQKFIPNTTMIRIHATTEPLTIVPPQPRMELPCNESDSVLRRIERWSQRHLIFDGIDFGGHCSVLWPDSRGSSFLVSRFLTEQAPPCGFENLYSCSHYVSLLHQTGTLRQDVRFCREHATLLANFFLFLGENSSIDYAADLFLAVGFSIPEGRKTWVVRRCKKAGEIVFWDAATGCAYPQKDESCPLQKIYFLASPDNLYANIDRGKRPLLLDFDLSNRRKWAPLNSEGNLEDAIFTAQDEALSFSQPDVDHAEEIQRELTESIQNAIRNWRRSPTSFRSDVSAKIAQMIEKLEQSKMNGRPSITSANDVFSERIVNRYHAFGFTLHGPFVSIQDVLIRIESSEIHRNQNPHVEYAITVRAFPYPGEVISLWVFVGSLVPKL